MARPWSDLFFCRHSYEASAEAAYTSLAMKRDLSPKSLAILAIAGSALVASTWFLGFVHIPRLQSNACSFWSVFWAYRLRVAAFCLPVVAGFAIAFWAERKFSRGFRSFQWTEAELASTKSMVTQSFWVWSAWLVLLAGILCAIVDRHMRGGALIYMLTLPFQSVGRIRRLVAPAAPLSSTVIDSRELQPIVSDHWGETRNSS